MVFSRLRKGRWIPTNGGNFLYQRHVRSLWASWHVLKVPGRLAGCSHVVGSGQRAEWRFAFDFAKGHHYYCHFRQLGHGTEAQKCATQARRGCLALLS